MRCLSFCVYRLEGGSRRQRYFLTPNPKLDAAFWQERGGAKVVMLTPPLNLAQAEQLQTLLQREASHQRQEERIVRKLLLQWGQKAELAVQTVQPSTGWEGHDEALSLHQHLSGRILLLEEIEQLIREKRLFLNYALSDLLHYLFLLGKLQCRPAIVLEPVKRCLRCGGTELRHDACFECGDTAGWTCLSCGEMGQAKSCRPYYAVASEHLPKLRSVRLELPAPLTAPQQLVAQAVQDFLLQSSRPICLFWAVCGAGKTETTLPAVQRVLAQGGRVLWATPRRDVVTELAPRLQAALPTTEVTALHGTAPERFVSSPLVVATTHQALRLFAAFDLVVLDEVDAFPYIHNPMLELAVRRAVKPDGKLIYLTATPTPELQKLARQGQAEQVILPLRHHGQPLPEPEIRPLRLPRSGDTAWRVPRLLGALLLDSVERDLCQTLVFVPSVDLAEQVGQALQQHFAERGNEDWVEYIHSKDDKREEKRSRFFAGEFPILVTTTLMERGITLPRLNVVVLYADSETIFTESVLIQIAGRVGRSSDYPTGKVFFLAERRSRSMLKARQTIRSLNVAARDLQVANKEATDNVES